MKKPASCLLSSLALLAGCASEPGFQGTPIPPESIGKIRLQVPPQNLAIHGFARSQDLEKRIAKNLAGWGYPTLAGSGQDYSHVMEASVGPVEKKSTPAGFSYSLGNSDPRAPEFQKADVVTVTCTLHSRDRPTTRAYLKEGFVADSALKGGESSKNAPSLFDLYVDHIGTTCFNLLSELHVKHTQPVAAEPAGGSVSTGAASSSWFPEVQVEIRQKPVPLPAGQAPLPSTPPVTAPENAAPVVEPSPAAETAVPEAHTAPAVAPVMPLPAAPPVLEQPAPTVKPAPPASTSGNTPTGTPPAPPSPPEPAAPAEPSPIRTETQQGEGRKQIIIHNKGNPIILEFGYERR